MTPTDPRLIDRLPLASWRLLVASAALLGVGYAAAGDLWTEGLAEQAGLATTGSYFLLTGVGLARPRTSWSWWRGGLATVLVLVALTTWLVFDAGTGSRSAVLLAVVVPLLVVVDYLAVGRDPGHRWWPLSWVALPVAYLVYAVSADVTRYDALNPAAPDRLVLLGFLGVALVIGLLLRTLVVVRLSAYARDISSSGR